MPSTDCECDQSGLIWSVCASGFICLNNHVHYFRYNETGTLRTISIWDCMLITLGLKAAGWNLVSNKVY